MRKAELIAAGLIIVGFLLRLLHVDFGGAIMFIGLVVLAFVYFPMGFAFFNLVRLKDSHKKESYNEVNTKRFYGAIVVGLALALVIVGSMFQLLLWPGGTLILEFGLAFTALAFIDAVFYYFRSKVPYYIRTMTRIAIIGFMGLVVYAVPQSQFVDMYHGNNPEYAELKKQYLDNPDDENIKERLKDLKSK